MPRVSASKKSAKCSYRKTNIECEREKILDIFSYIDKADVKNLIDMYNEYSKRYQVRSREIDRIIHVAVNKRDIERLRALMKDFIFFAPCINELNELSTKYFITLIRKLSDFSNAVDSSLNLDKKIMQELLIEVSLSKEIPDKKDIFIANEIDKLTGINFEEGEYNSPNMSWLTFKKSLDRVLRLLEDIVEDGIICRDLLEHLEESLMKLANDSPETCYMLSSLRRALERFKQREFYKTQ
jgi:hypothetical protein